MNKKIKNSKQIQLGINFTGKVKFSSLHSNENWLGKRVDCVICRFSSVKDYKTIVETFNCCYLFYSSLLAALAFDVSFFLNALRDVVSDSKVNIREAIFHVNVRNFISQEEETRSNFMTQTMSCYMSHRTFQR